MDQKNILVKLNVLLLLFNTLHVSQVSGFKSDAKDGGISQLGGVLTELPPCQMEGNKIIHSNRSCVYLRNSSDQKRWKDDIHPLDEHQTQGNMTSVKNTDEDNHTGRPRGGGGDVSGKGGTRHDGMDDPYDRDGRYWLVPPFLIGASSVIVVYIIIHCLYLHCYAKRKLGQMASRTASTPAIIFSDGDGPSTSSLMAYTPIVKYEGAYGKTEMMESQPFLFYQPNETSEAVSPELSERRPSRRKSSMHLQLPQIFNRKGKPRTSVCSASATMQAPKSTPGETSSDSKQELRKARASICFVPVARTISDPTGGTGVPKQPEWTPLQGFLYPSVMLPSNPSLSVASGSFSSINKEDVPPPSPLIFVPNSSESGDQATDGSTSRRESEYSRKLSVDPSSRPSSRKTLFREPESETVTIEIPSQTDSED